MNGDLNFRISKPEDGLILKEWLLEPGILRWFPICNVKEIDDSIQFWLSYIKIGAAISVESGGQLLGMSTLYLNFYEKMKHHTLFVICVAPQARGQGVGSALMNYMTKLAKEQFHIELLHLEMYDGNPAQHLYERLGFKEYGRHPRFLKEEDGNYRTRILMQKRL